MTRVLNTMHSAAFMALVAAGASCDDHSSPTAPSLPPGTPLAGSALLTSGSVSAPVPANPSRLLPDNHLPGGISVQTASMTHSVNGLHAGPDSIPLEPGPATPIFLSNGESIETPEPSPPVSIDTEWGGSPLNSPTYAGTDTSAERALRSSDRQDSTGQPDAVTVTVNSLRTGPDGSTLKVKPVTLLSPVNDTETDDLTPLLTVSSTEAQFIPQDQFAARGDAYVFFEISVVPDDGNSTVVDANETLQTTGITSYQINVALEETTRYQWRARSKIGDELGPWSTTATFRTPTLVKVGIPTPLSPSNGAMVSTTYPEFIVTNPEVVGAYDVIIEFRMDDEGPTFPHPSTFNEPLGTGGITADGWRDPLAIGQQFWWGVRAKSSVAGITTPWSETYTFTTSVTAGTRTPDPPPGQQLELPNQAALINQLAVTHAAALANSNVHEGGNWDFMDAAVEALRQTDTRWGYNCKRGDCNHLSIDVVNYFYGTGDGLYNQDVYLIDIIRGIKSNNPGPAWTDITESTADNDTIGRWLYPRPIQ